MPSSPLFPAKDTSNSLMPTTVPLQYANREAGTKQAYKKTKKKNSNNSTVWQKVSLLTIILLSMFVALAVYLYLDLTEIENSSKELKQQVEELEAKVKSQQDILDAREGFIAVLPEVNEAVSAAEGKVDVSTQLQQIEASKTLVAEERANPNAILLEIGKVKSAATIMKSSVEEYDRVQLNLRNLTGTTAERALDDISKGTVTFAIGDGDPCGNELAIACVSSDNPTQVIGVAKYINSYGYAGWYSIMTHEYAHTIQFTNYAEWASSNGFINVFGSDVEWYADCMARERVGSSYQSGYGYECSPEQLNIASEAWNANFI